MIYSKDIEDRSTPAAIELLEGAMRPTYMVNAYYREFLAREYKIDIEPFRSDIPNELYKCRVIPTNKNEDVYVIDETFNTRTKALEAGLKEGLKIIKIETIKNK